jgi:hypothetical protein
MAKINKKQIVEELITSNVGWTEDEREWLMEQNTDRLQRMLPVDNKSNLTEGSGKAPGAGATDEEEESGDMPDSQSKKTLGGKGKKMAKNEEADEEEDDESVENEESEEESDADETVKNEEGEEMTDEEKADAFIESAPPAIREVLRGGIAAMNVEKRKLISTITANARCKFRKEQLQAKELSELRQIAMLASNEDNFDGAQGAAPIVDNEEEGLALPVTNFGREDASEKKNRRKAG